MTTRHILPLAVGCCVVAVWMVPTSSARFAAPQLQEVPIARLVENLEKAAAKDPKDAKIRYNLARVHAMAYADKTENCQIQVGKEMNGPWFGFTPKFVPFTPKASDNEAKLALAKEHLAKAVSRYKETLELDKNNLAAKLGLAWCLDQAKNKGEAIKAYRDVLGDAWKDDMNRKSLPIGGNVITTEAAGYLIPLLDKVQDKDEIATLQERVAKLNKLPRPVTPVVIPLRDGLTAFDMVDPKARVRFDVDGTGFTHEWTWFTKDAGILVYDPLGKRNITSGIQWFGNVTFWMFWDNGYEALSALDDNGDGMLSGKELTGLCVWIDANGDGVCQPGEIKSLAELGIVSISCRHEIDTSHPDRVPFSQSGVTFASGSTRTTFDVFLRKW